MYVMLVVLALPRVAAAALVDAVAVTAGINSERAPMVHMVRLSLQKYWHQHWFARGRWELTGYWELGFGHWYGPAGMTNNDVEDIDFRPVFRLQRKVSSTDTPQFYVEGGVGPALISKTRLGPIRFSTAFQFGSNLGVGVRFGPHHRYDLAYRFMHYSNADIKEPNNGISFNVLQLAVGF